jgi:hypothetical protein
MRHDLLIANLYADQVLEIFLNESSKNTENALIEWLRKETTRYFTKTKVYVVSSVLSLFFKISLVCLKSVKLEMPGNFQVRFQISRNTYYDPKMRQDFLFNSKHHIGTKIVQ